MAASDALPPRPRGVLSALANLAATMAAMAQTRLAVWVDDFERALLRGVVLLCWAAAGLFALALGLVSGLAAIVWAVQPDDRPAVLAAAAVMLVLLGAAAIAVVRERARRP